MQLNIFKIPKADVPLMRVRLDDAGMSPSSEVEQAGWATEFWFADNPEPTDVGWAKTFQDFLPDGAEPQNVSYFGVFIWVTGENAFAISFGKAHFYVRPFCDYDFGIELAKRIADPDDSRQTSSRRFAGRRTKDIQSFVRGSGLTVEPGESVDFLQAAVRTELASTFGKVARFGVSAQLGPKDLKVEKIGKFLDDIVTQLAAAERFKLPRTTYLSDEDEIAKYDEQLLDHIFAEAGLTDFAENAFDLYGVDFVFSAEGTFTLKWNYKKRVLDVLSIRELREFIDEHSIPRDQVLDIKVVRELESGIAYREKLKEALDFIADDDNVVLRAGRWMRFNDDYLEALNEAVARIQIIPTEDEFAEISTIEDAFNTSEAIAAAGYEVYDKNFDVLKVNSSTQVEAWDLFKDTTAYAVKFGTAQKLGQVCDQATLTIELIRNRANTTTLPTVDRYCLWLGYRVQGDLPTTMAETGSIILKQKLQAWARTAVNAQVTPVIKLSKKLPSTKADEETDPEVEDAVSEPATA